MDQGCVILMVDVTALGELLIDFTPAGNSANSNPLYEQNPGGAPANVLTAVVRQGGTAALISGVGEDGFGHFLCSVVKKVGIDTSGLQFVTDACTTLAFVSLDEQGNRSFNFCRKPGADQRIQKERIPLDLLTSCRIFHFGSLSLSHEPSRTAALFAADYAKKNGSLISYDPNWRPPLWSSEEEGIAGMKLGLPLTDLLKLSEEELLLFTGTEDCKKGTDILLAEFPNLKLIVVTLGPKGCFYRCGSQSGFLPTYDTKVIDTTGSGDTFWGTLLVRIAHNPEVINEKSTEALCEYLDAANAAGSLCAAGRGAIPSIPNTEAVKGLQRTCPKLI